MAVVDTPFDLKSFKPKLSSVPGERWWGSVKNQSFQSPNALFEAPTFKLIIVEFDDQGRCFDGRTQLHVLQEELAKLEKSDPVILTFVHGWKHNGASSDDNLQHFCTLLRDAEDEINGRKDEADKTPVVGIFVAWRGQSFWWAGLTELTFWSRKRAGLRVAMGSTRELFERLRQYRKNAIANARTPVVVIIGHSFGGLIVFSALCQSLISAAIAPINQVIPSFANLVLLVNPAFEAVRYLPIFDLVKERNENGVGVRQEPVFVSVTAENDTATKRYFKWGMRLGASMQAKRTPEERTTLYHTMGHVPFLKTHELSLPTGATKAQCKRVKFDETNAYWVAWAKREVIDNHNGIWLPVFQEWVRDLVAKQLAGPQNPMLVRKIMAQTPDASKETPRQ